MLLIFLIKNESDFFHEIGCSERDINRLKIEFKNILIEQHEKYLDYVKNEEESIFENFLKK